MGLDPRLIDGYQIHRFLGQGGMGEVFEATDARFQRRVALKVLNENLVNDPDAQQRFLGEAQTLARLNSPHVVQVFDAGISNERLYIAMQLVEGRDLQSVLEHSGGLPLARAATLISQVGMALEDAHEIGLLHRDVKPHNILLRETGTGREFAYLADFGIARLAESGHTMTRGVIGTPSYMAPEVHQGERPSQASDIYSLGCVLWATLRGRPPYEGTTEFQIAQGHVNGEMPSLEGPAQVVGPVNAVLHRALAKRPEDRWPSVREFVSELDAAVAAGRADTPSGETTVIRPRPVEVGTLPTAGDGAAGVTTGPPAPADPADPAARPRGRGRRRALVAALVLACIVGAAAAARAVFSPSEDGAEVAGSAQAGEPSDGGEGTEKQKQQSQGPVTCWNGKPGATAQACPVPKGRAGMATVFPAVSDTSRCVDRFADASIGKLEVFVCTYDTFRIRYSRWDPQADRIGYYRDANSEPKELPWRIEEKVVGRSWTSTEPAPDYPFQWSATYREHPFSVSVEGEDIRARARGINGMEAAPPAQIGLQP